MCFFLVILHVITFISMELKKDINTFLNFYGFLFQQMLCFYFCDIFKNRFKTGHNMTETVPCS